VAGRDVGSGGRVKEGVDCAAMAGRRRNCRRSIGRIKDYVEVCGEHCPR
jgi:hypothetical protein